MPAKPGDALSSKKEAFAMEIVPVGEHELPALVDISRETFTHTYAHLNDPDNFRQYVARAYAPEKLAAEMATAGSFFFFARQGDQIAGYTKLNIPRPVRELPGEAHIEVERIYVRDTYKGQGIGRALLHHAITFGQHHQMEYLWLGAWQKNTPALAWYQRQGLAIFATHVFQLGNEAQDDYLLFLSLTDQVSIATDHA